MSPRASLEGWSLECKMCYKKGLMLATICQYYRCGLLPRPSFQFHYQNPWSWSRPRKSKEPWHVCWIFQLKWFSSSLTTYKRAQNRVITERLPLQQLNRSLEKDRSPQKHIISVTLPYDDSIYDLHQLLRLDLIQHKRTHLPHLHTMNIHSFEITLDSRIDELFQWGQWKVPSSLARAAESAGVKLDIWLGYRNPLDFKRTEPSTYDVVHISQCIFS